MRYLHRIKKALFDQSHRIPPRTFNEKVKWKMKYDRRPLLTLTADKYLVQNYLIHIGFGHLLKKMYFVTTNPRDIPFDDLPKRYVIKTSNSWNDLIIVDDGFDLITQTSITREEIISKCKLFLQRRHPNELKEWAYQGIKSVLIVEEFLTDENGVIPADYKFHCFHGEVKLVLVVSDRFGNLCENLYDKEWNPMNFCWIGEYGPSPISNNLSKPLNFDTMVEIAETLSKPFDFVRIDLYSVSNKIYFGEFTHYPSAAKDKFLPDYYDAIVGEYWTLPDINAVCDNSILAYLQNACLYIYCYLKLLCFELTKK